MKVTALDGLGGETVPTSEVNCTGVVNGSDSVATSTVCDLTWTAISNATDYRVYVATTSDTYFGYLTATTTNQFTLTATSTMTSGAIPSASTAYISQISSTLAKVMSFTQGGGVTASSTDDLTALLLNTDFDTENYLQLTPNLSGITYTLPASSTVDNIPSTGDCRQLVIENATTTPTLPFTLAAGTGWSLNIASTSIANINETKYATLNFCRRSDTDITGLLTLFNN